jgi:hypothetical protein
MTVHQSATGANNKLRARGRHWTWGLVSAGPYLGLAVYSLATGPWLLALGFLVAACGNVSIALGQRNYGVDLTPQHAIVRGFRRRNVPWREIQGVISHKKSNGTSFVALILENGESVILQAPNSGWDRVDAQYEEDLHYIDQYWLAHRGESWHPVTPEAPSPPVQ